MRRAGARWSLAAVAPSLLAVAIGGSAIAHFTNEGSGSGTAQTGTTLPLTLSPAAPSTQLFPGGQADLTLIISNANLAEIRVGSLTLDVRQGTGGFAVDAIHAGCSTSALSLTRQTDGWVVPARVGAVDGTQAVTLPNAVAMGSTAANACQDATFSVYLIAGP